MGGRLQMRHSQYEIRGFGHMISRGNPRSLLICLLASPDDDLWVRWKGEKGHTDHHPS
jgi:hypothetical protein